MNPTEILRPTRTNVCRIVAFFLCEMANSFKLQQPVVHFNSGCISRFGRRAIIGNTRGWTAVVREEIE